MNVERALLSKALQTGGISTLLARGVEKHLFAQTPDGQLCAQVFDWAASHTRRHNVPPSPALLKERWPDWAGEPSSDPLEALIESFLTNVKRRYFAAKVRELFAIGDDPSKWGQLDEILMDQARDFAALISSSRASKLSEMEQRIMEYEAEKASGKPPGFDIGIPDFDYMIGGVRPGNVIILSGYLGIGKSLLSSWVTLNVVEQGHSALFIPLEMSRHEVLERIDAMIINFSHRLLRNRELAEEDMEQWRRIAVQYRALEKDLTVLDGVGNFTINRLWAEISRHKPDFTVVDYVQLMRRSDSSMQQWQGLVEITNECKAIALATESVIMLVSQDNREAAQGGSTLATMGGSISVGQVGDIYIGMHQDENMRTANRMAVKLLKVRNGARDRTANLDWDPSHMRFAPAKEGAESFQRQDSSEA